MKQIHRFNVIESVALSDPGDWRCRMAMERACERISAVDKRIAANKKCSVQRKVCLHIRRVRLH